MAKVQINNTVRDATAEEEGEFDEDEDMGDDMM